MKMKSNRKMSVLMFPWLGHGHISPFLELAKQLTKRNFTVTLCSTPANLSSIKKKLDSELSRSICFYSLCLEPSPDLPHNLHTTNGLPSHLMAPLKEAFDGARKKFYDILVLLKPDLLIYDLIQYWAPVEADLLLIPSVVFITTSATMASSMFHLYQNGASSMLQYENGSGNGTEKYPYPEIYYRQYEKMHITEVLEGPANGFKDKDRVMKSVLGSSDIVLIKSFKELEGPYSDHLSRLTEKLIVPVGPLVQKPHKDDLDPNGRDIIKWLDSKERGSTIFVSFGSEYFLSEDDFREIAHGLEMSNVNFIWVVRFPKGEDTIKVEDVLPLGFLERVGMRGWVEEGWAPQARILEHKSIGGFVSHCGWSSVMESMHFGVPIIAMPMHLDQPVNSRLIGKFGNGKEVVRDMNGRLKGEDVAEVVRYVVIDEAGKHVRDKAREVSDKLRKKGDEEINKVVEELRLVVDFYPWKKKAMPVVVPMNIPGDPLERTFTV